jgi:hypothetical protein
MEYKTAIGIIAAVFTCVAYIPYIRDILRGKTTPHIITWLIWTLTIGISVALQLYGGAGAGAWTAVATLVFNFLIFLLCFKKGSSIITKRDIIFLVLALFSLFLWLVVHQPVYSMILIVLTEFFGFAPTIQKAWHQPHSETLFTWEINVLRQVLSLFALTQLNILTLFYPVSWALANMLFVLILIMRRRIIYRSSAINT